MTDRTLVVFTYCSIQTMVAERVSRSWALNAEKVRRCTYLVCTRNRNYANAALHERAAAPEDHRAAFMVRKIAAVEQSLDTPGRHVVRFYEYARLHPPRPNVWPGHQNPVWYVESIRDLGILPDNLNWVAIPDEQPSRYRAPH